MTKQEAVKKKRDLVNDKARQYFTEFPFDDSVSVYDQLRMLLREIYHYQKHYFLKFQKGFGWYVMHREGAKFYTPKQ